MNDNVCHKNDILELDIVNMGNDGEGIGRVDGYTLFVKDALAGDRVRVKVMKTRKHFGYAKLLEILSSSPDRVEPVCPVAKQCGGCQLQHCSYERQLRYKEEKVKGCLERIGGFQVHLPIKNMSEIGSGKKNLGSRLREEEKEAVIMEPVLSMKQPYFYRNKAQFPVGIDKGENLIAGFYAGRTHQIIPNTNCIIQHPCNQMIVETILGFMKEYNISAYDEVMHRGLVRHILTRVGSRTGDIMVCLVVNGKVLPSGDKLVEGLLALDFGEVVRKAHLSLKEKEKCVENEREEFRKKEDTYIEREPRYTIRSICINENTEKTNVILGKKLSTLYGQGYIEDYIGEIKYRISPLSFYQVNPVQTEKLYLTVLEYADLKGGEIVWDLYCGIGTISLFLAQKAEKVCGVEIVEQAVEDARENARMNHIDNAEFFTGAAEEVVPRIYEESNGALRADVVTLDPPRKGCDEKLLETVLQMEPEKIVYVSCDPATLARDLKYLCGKGYELKRVRACDMFGFSEHVESVIKLQRR